MNQSPFNPIEHLEHATQEAIQAREQMDLDSRSFGHLEAAIAQLRTTKALLGGDEPLTESNQQ